MAKEPFPQDRGWAWVVFAGCWSMMFVVLGLTKCMGLFLVEFHHHFHVPLSVAAIFLAVMSVAIALLGPVFIVLGQTFTIRRVVLCGGFLAFIGMALSSLLLSMEFIALTFGLCLGIGNSVVGGNCLVILGMYFNKHRTLANGLALTGGSLGQFALPPFIEFLLETYGLQGCILIVSGLILNLLVGGSLFRPVSYWARNTAFPSSLPSSYPTQITSVKDGQNKQHTGEPENEMKGLKENGSERNQTIALEIENDEENEEETIATEDDELIKKEGRMSATKGTQENNGEVDKRTRRETERVEENDQTLPQGESQSTEEDDEKGILLSTVAGTEDKLLAKNGRKHCRYKALNQNPNSEAERTKMNKTASQTLASEVDPTKSNGPASPNSASERGSAPPSQIPTSQADRAKTKGPAPPPPNPGLCVKLKAAVDFSVMKSYVAVFLLLSTLLGLFGAYNFVVFLPAISDSRGLAHYNKALLLSVSGIGDLLGRLVIGALGDRRFVSRYKMQAGATVLMGANILVFYFSSSLVWMLVHSALHGIFVAVATSLLAVVIIDFVGLSKMPRILAVVFLVQGLTMALGQPFLGAVRDATESFNEVILLCSLMSMAGGMLAFCYPLVLRLEVRRPQRFQLLPPNYMQTTTAA